MTAKERFDKFFENYDIKKYNDTIKDICWLFYSQGVNDTESGVVHSLKELSADELQRIFDDSNFIEDVKYWIEHPESGTILSNDRGVVKVTVPCHDPTRTTCVSWPDRCQECGGDGVTCTDYVDLYKLCGVTPIRVSKKKVDYKGILSQAEIDNLAAILNKMNESNAE